MTYQFTKKPFTPKDPKEAQIKDYKILIQNLFNRAVEITLHNSIKNNTPVDEKTLTDNLLMVKKIVSNDIKQYKNKLK